MSQIFVTGIGTDVGKTVVSAILTEALQADYFKPIQAGDLDNSDTHKIKSWVTNSVTQFHDNAFALQTPMSPHAAAEIDGVQVQAASIQRPVTDNHLVIEGAGGLLVPINATETILDLIQPEDKVVVVSRHYLGSINHTLMTLELLKQKEAELSLWFNGDEHPSTESIILSKYPVPVIGRINQEPEITHDVVSRYAALHKESIQKYLL